MAFVAKKDLKDLYNQSKQEAHIWREDYPAYERLADNGLMEGLDANLPEVNDGSLAAALFKLPKRIISNNLSGTVKSIDRDEVWLSELANMQWEDEIIPYANSQAPFIRKWKDSVRKAAIYGSVPLITLFVEKDGRRHADFIVAQPQDVTLEPGKVSDYDSDVMFWDVYYTKTQLENMIEQAKEEQKEAKENKEEGYNKWNIPALEAILKSDDLEERSSLDTPRQEVDKAIRPQGFKFCITVQRGVDAPFYMYHSATNKTVREWTNPDPTGDVPIHFLYCYQDFINPYGIGICKLAGGTQNVLDYMRQADVLATQLGLRPPIQIAGNADDVDIDSLVYAQDALWFTGQATVTREEMSNQVYQQLPDRMSMYKTSLNQLIPVGDTSIQSGSGDPQYSKTPAGVKFQAASLSIDDEDFKDNVYVTYAAVAKSMINTQFANMEGADIMRLSDEQREILMKGGLEFPEGEDGELASELEIKWDDVRAKFDFEVDPENDKAKDDADKLEGLKAVAELSAADPTFAQDLAAVNKKFNKGELYADMVALTTDNDKIVTDIGPEDQMDGEQGQVDPNAQPMPEPKPLVPYDKAPEDVKRQMEMKDGYQPSQDQSIPQQDIDIKVAQLEQSQLQQDHSQMMAEVGAEQSAQQMQQPEQQMPQEQEEPDLDEEQQANVEAVMDEHNVDENTALQMLAAEAAGLDPQAILEYVKGA